MTSLRNMRRLKKCSRVLAQDQWRAIEVLSHPDFQNVFKEDAKEAVDYGVASA